MVFSLVHRSEKRLNFDNLFIKWLVVFPEVAIFFILDIIITFYNIQNENKFRSERNSECSFECLFGVQTSCLRAKISKQVYPQAKSFSFPKFVNGNRKSSFRIFFSIFAMTKYGFLKKCRHIKVISAQHWVLSQILY